MVESVLTVYDSSHDATELTSHMTVVDTAGSNFLNDGKTVLFVVNGDATTPSTLGVLHQRDCSCGVGHDVSKVCAASTTYVVGPFDTRTYNDGDEKCHITWTATDPDIKVVAVRVTAAP